jgi:hypothetical protein
MLYYSFVNSLQRKIKETHALFKISQSRILYNSVKVFGMNAPLEKVAQNKDIWGIQYKEYINKDGVEGPGRAWPT